MKIRDYKSLAEQHTPEFFERNRGRLLGGLATLLLAVGVWGSSENHTRTEPHALYLNSALSVEDSNKRYLTFKTKEGIKYGFLGDPLEYNLPINPIITGDSIYVTLQLGVKNMPLLPEKLKGVIRE